MRISVRWRDIDMLGHLNQAVYHEFLEEARATLLMELATRAHDFSFVLARVELDYRHEVRRDHGHVDVVARVASVGRSSITVANEVRLPDGTVAASGTTVLVSWDMAERRSKRLTPEQLERLNAAA